MIWGWLVTVMCALAGPLEEGAASFEEGGLQEAILSWEEVPASDRSWAVSYNLSLAKYRQGHVGEAIGLLREAKERKPRGAVVHHNLAYVRSELDAVPRPVGEVRSWLELLTPGELGAFSVVLACVGLVGVWRRRRDASLDSARPWWALWAVGILGLYVAWDAASLRERQPVAVVTVSEV